MGRWFAQILDEHMIDSPAVTFTDTNPETADAAATAVDGRTIPLDTVEQFDLVCVAVPLPATETAIETHARNARRAMCDLAGAMAGPVSEMVDNVTDRERVSFHPLFAPENGPGNIPLVAETPGPVTDRVRDALVAAGNNLFETTVEEHDTAMETVQARTHAAVLAFGLAAEPIPDRFQTPISDSLFDLLDGVTGGEPRVYADIQAAFDGASDVARAAEQIAQADDAAFEALYRDARPTTSTDE